MGGARETRCTFALARPRARAHEPARCGARRQQEALEVVMLSSRVSLAVRITSVSARAARFSGVLIRRKLRALRLVRMEAVVEMIDRVRGRGNVE